MSDHNLRSAPSHTVDGSSLLFDQVKPLDRISIMSSLPPKHEVDRLIAQFFDRQSFPIAVPRKYQLPLPPSPIPGYLHTP